MFCPRKGGFFCFKIERLSHYYVYISMSRNDIIQLNSCLELEKAIGRATDPKNSVNFDQFFIDLLSHLEDEFGTFMSELDATFDFERWAITFNSLKQAFRENDNYLQTIAMLHYWLTDCLSHITPRSVVEYALAPKQA